MKNFNPDYYKDHSKEELIKQLCTSTFDLLVLKHILASTGYNMKQPLDYSYYQKILDPTNELKGVI